MKNFLIKFGTIWLVITNLILLMFLPGILFFRDFMSNFEIEDVRSFDFGMVFPFFIFFCIFEVIGIVILRFGIKQAKIDKKTEQYGTPVYGKIFNIVATGSHINGRRELAAHILAYIPTTGSVESFNEIIGFAPINYYINDWVLLKYYEGDVNIVEKVNEVNVPIDAFDKINEKSFNLRRTSSLISITWVVQLLHHFLCI